MDEYKLSEFTYFCTFDNRLLLVNTLSKKLMYSEMPAFTGDILDKVRHREPVDTDSPVFQKLCDNGYLVKTAVNEPLIAKKRYWDTVYDTRLGITLMPTEQCNCRCPYCYESFSKPKMDSQTVQNLLLFLKKNLIRYTGLNISWFGGEPLLAMDVMETISREILDICHARRMLYDSSITTNGVLLTPDVFRRLLSLRISRFQITLDGPKETHDRTRVFKNGGGTFDIIMNNLLAIKESKTSTVRINIRINLTKESLKNLPEFLDFLYDRFGDDKRFFFYFRPIGDWNHNIEAQTLKDSLLPSLYHVYEILLQHPKKLNYGILYQMIMDSMCYASKKNHFVLGSDGTVYKCTVYFDEEINQVGKLVDGGKIVWDEEKLAKWINNDFSSSKCRDCFMNATCHEKGCPAKDLIYGKQSGCGHEAENISNILKLLYQSKDLHHFYEKLEA